SVLNHSCSLKDDCEHSFSTPLKVPNLRNSNPLQRVHLKHSFDNIPTWRSEVSRKLEDSGYGMVTIPKNQTKKHTSNFLEQIGDVIVVKGKSPCEQCKQNHSTTPNVDLLPCIQSATCW